MTYNNRNNNRRSFNPATDKVQLTLVSVKIVGIGRQEGNDTIMPPALVVNKTIAVNDAIKAWRNEYNIPVNVDHRSLCRPVVRVVTPEQMASAVSGGKPQIGAKLVTQDEADRIEDEWVDQMIDLSDATMMV